MRKTTSKGKLKGLLKKRVEREEALVSEIQSLNGTRNKSCVTGMRNEVLILMLLEERGKQTRVWKELERQYFMMRVCK
jgi:hypothetical protein